MKGGKSFFRNEARWNMIVHCAILLLGLLMALLLPLLAGWLRSGG